MGNPVNLFEYQNKESLSSKVSLLNFLNKIWEEREKTIYFRNQPKEDDEIETEADRDDDIKSQQQFISVFGNTIKARNYVGVIHFEGVTYNLLPKIFYDGYNKKLEEEKNKTKEQEPIKEYLNEIQKNILWWLGYSKRLKFPKLQSNFNKIKADSFFEILIYLFSNFTRELLTRQIYQNYTEIDRELSFMKGRINMNAYIKDNLCTGNWAKISCTYDSFEIDNQLNRIIKYVAKLLLSHTQRSKQALREIIFTLDEVTDLQITAADCEKVKINPLFTEMQTVLDYCKLFLTNSMVFTWKNDLKVFAFLIPMEKIFEEFIFEFIERHQSEIFNGEKYKVKSQASEYYLASLKKDDDANIYQLKNDILITNKKENTFIIDTKYKLAYYKDFKPSQSDMYQMVSYAIRQKCNQVKLFYPKSDDKSDVIDCKQQHYVVKDEFAEKFIDIKVYQLPIIATDFPENKSYEKPLKDVLKIIFANNL